MIYEGDVYRPPSEARSLIIQITIGCANNRCTFCSMYKEKKFRIRTKEEIFKDLEEMSLRYGQYPIRIFLADGDALVVPTGLLLEILQFIRLRFPICERVTAYATAKDICRKTTEELALLKNAGLTMVYVGAESGDEQILRDVNKNVSCEEMLQAAGKLKEAGIQLSLTLISGGGKRANGAACSVFSKVGFRDETGISGVFNPLTGRGDAHHGGNQNRKAAPAFPDRSGGRNETVFNACGCSGYSIPANHASNYISLRGTLNTDIPAMLKKLEKAEENHRFKAEHYRMF